MPVSMDYPSPKGLRSESEAESANEVTNFAAQSFAF